MANGVVTNSGPPTSRILEAVADTSESDDSGPSTLIGGSPAAIKNTVDDQTIEEIASGEPVDLLDLKKEEEKKEKLKLIKDETQSSGAVSLGVYKLYMETFGGYLIWGIAFAMFIGAQISDVVLNLALKSWAASYDQQDHEALNAYLSPVMVYMHGDDGKASVSPSKSDYWMWQYIIWGIINLTLYALRVAFFLYRGLIASRKIYLRLINRILEAPPRFFDSTPTGRIINRLSKDMETVDQDVSPVFMFLFIEIFGAIGIISAIAVVMPMFLIVGAGMFILYGAIGFAYIASSRELKRTESTSRSPIFSVVGEALQGVTTIRAYGDIGRFMKRLIEYVDTNNRPFVTIWFGNRWLSYRTDVSASLMAAMVSIFILLSPRIDAALAGFILSYSISFNERMLWCVRLWSIVEINLNSVERIQEYMELEKEKLDGDQPPASWPSRAGEIVVEDFSCRYAKELSPVLKGVSFTVKPGEKIGIVGRTGSGKSTLALSFFRFIEADTGRIVIDGLDISKVALRTLRERLTIIPQDAYLFKGTVRFNLDPFSVRDDADLWDALHRVGLSNPSSNVSRTESYADLDVTKKDTTDVDGVENERYIVKSLEMKVEEGGKNFSAGQRQLLALARGLLKLSTSSILILDESTASLDHATDERIQRTIREEMGDSTILTIAHRLKTIIDYDKILVLSKGELVEFDTPFKLLQDDLSAFSELCRRSGEYDALYEAAKSKAASYAV